MTSGVDADGHRRVPSVHVRFEGGAAGGGAKDDGALLRFGVEDYKASFEQWLEATGNATPPLEDTPLDAGAVEVDRQQLPPPRVQ